jgi:tetratricopeptide (TPR) repeat protein
MLEKKLERASEASAKQNTRMVAIFFVALLSCIAIIVLISTFNSKMPQPGSSEVVPVHAADPVEQSGLREQFMKRLQAYETELKPDIIDANLKNWNLEKDAEITSFKEAAISAFGMGDYAAALEHLTKLGEVARLTLEERDALFSSEITAARLALNQDNHTTGKLHITKALQLKPGDQEAQDIEQKLDALPELLALLKRAEVAGIENNPEKEFAALAEAVKLAPHRDELKQRRDELAERIRENRFLVLISSGLFSVDKKELRAARSSYKQANTLFPGRSELRVLNEGIVKASAALDLKQSIALTKKAAAQDDWVRAQSVYSGAAKRHPKEKRIVDGLQLSNRLVELQQAVADYISRSERLSSGNVFEAAQNTAIQAAVFAPYSLSLKEKVVELKELLASMNVEIPVFVKSDNQTYILVRGVGKVGLTHGRNIQLKPGEYTFEGSRTGYKSKLVRVRLPVGKASFQVEVICDERI